MILQFKNEHDQRTLVSRSDQGQLLIELMQGQKIVTTVIFSEAQVAELRDYLQAVFP